MPALRDLVESLGYEDVSTYIASGNVLFSTPKKDAGKVAAELEKAIETELGVSCRVAVISRDELETAARNNPFPDEKNLKAVHAVFLLEDAPSGVDATQGK